MLPFSEDELARMQVAQESAMMDRCILLTKYEQGRDGHNNPIYGEAKSRELICGLDPTASQEIPDGSEVVLIDARLRLSLSTESSIRNISRVKIVKRFGVILDPPLIFEVVGLPERGPSGIVLNLRFSTRPDTETR